MKLRAVLLLLMLTVPCLHAQIKCDRFEINQRQEGDTLIVSLDTDLPDYTSIMVRVERSYWEKGNEATYSCEYYSVKSTVGEWRKQRRIDISDSKWLTELRKEQAKMAKIGLGFDVSKIDEQVDVSIVVPINQSNQAFGEENSKLKGKAVPKEGLRVVKQKANIHKPLKNNASGDSPYENIDPSNLTMGNAYFVSRDTPLMSHHSPAAPMFAIGQKKSIPPGGAFKILKQHAKGSTPWYEVVAIDANRRRIGKGWINSTALLGQDIELYKKEETSKK